MKRLGILAGLCVAILGLVGRANAGEIDFSASIGLEARGFVHSPAHAGQISGVQPSLIVESELVWESDNRAHQFFLNPWARIDGRDQKRTHADLREAYYAWSSGDWRLRLGLGRVFWGVTESRHLVDIINQTDLVEDIDEEDKLGQPMVEFSTLQDFGEIRLYVLPAFRERTFPGPDGRFRGPLIVDGNSAQYESAAENTRTDVAARYSNYFGDWDVGISLFNGTSREPRFLPSPTPGRLIPFYDVITQAGLDVQYTRDAWLWKFEGIVRSGQSKTFGALVAGLEYTFFGISESRSDLGVLFEYLHDGRDSNPALAPPTAMENDIFLGSRYALNDTQDTQILAGGIIDIDTGSVVALTEGSRRFGQNWIAEIEARMFFNVDDTDVLAPFKKDNAITLRVTRYF